MLYSSADDVVVREVVRAFEAKTGHRVAWQGDTEATKTTGLVLRLVSEKAAPKADVWWSSEVFGSVRLADEGVLSPALPMPELNAGTPWPGELRDDQGRWFGFALRARVLAVSGSRVAEQDRPTSLGDLTDPRWKGRIGMARPEFGTTRGHMAWLLDCWGEESFREWVRAMGDNDVRLYSGNAGVVQGVANGEIDIGLTDTDDVWAGQRNGWDIVGVFERVDGAGDGGRFPSPGPMLMPNTAGLVAGGPNPGLARELLDFLLSSETEKVLASSDSRNIPVTPGVDLDPRYRPPGGRMPDPGRTAAAADKAVSICAEVLGTSAGVR